MEALLRQWMFYPSSFFGMDKQVKRNNKTNELCILVWGMFMYEKLSCCFNNNMIPSCNKHFDQSQSSGLCFCAMPTGLREEKIKDFDNFSSQDFVA